MFPHSNRKALVEVLKAVCSKPGVDCTQLLTAFTGSTDVPNIVTST